jgi:hypothetical protein
MSARAGSRAIAMFALGVALAAPPPARAAAATSGTAPADSARAAPVSASDLYNAGTVALERGDVGAAVTFLTAAARIQPRATDVRANLAAAAIQVARLRGEDEGSADADSKPFPLSPAEEWWIAAVLLAAGSALGIVGSMRAMHPAARWTGRSLLVLGIALSGTLHLAAWREAQHPEAVVIVPALTVERGPDEPSRPAVLLSAGERVRLGRTRGDLVEIRFGGNPIGWAPRSGLWRLSDAPRYTERFRSG